MNDSNLLATYPPFNTKLLNGNDVFLYDDKGNEYLDCLAGIAVVSLGHANVEIANVIAEQSKNLFMSRIISKTNTHKVLLVKSMKKLL